MRGVPKNIVAPCLFRAVGEVAAGGEKASRAGGRKARKASRARVELAPARGRGAHGGTARVRLGTGTGQQGETWPLS